MNIKIYFLSVNFTSIYAKQYVNFVVKFNSFTAAYLCLWHIYVCLKTENRKTVQDNKELTAKDQFARQM